MTSAVSAAGLYKYWTNEDLSKQRITVAKFVKQLYKNMEIR